MQENILAWQSPGALTTFSTGTRYDQVNAMLLNEFLKACRRIDAQQKLPRGRRRDSSLTSGMVDADCIAVLQCWPCQPSWPLLPVGATSACD